jgi:hypothetical protein
MHNCSSLSIRLQGASLVHPSDSSLRFSLHRSQRILIPSGVEVESYVQVHLDTHPLHSLLFKRPFRNCPRDMAATRPRPRRMRSSEQLTKRIRGSARARRKRCIVGSPSAWALALPQGKASMDTDEIEGEAGHRAATRIAAGSIRHLEN